MKNTRLKLLHELARLRADLSAARLAKRQKIVRELEAKDSALRAPLGEIPGTLAERITLDRYDHWRRQELSRLAVTLAQAHAQAQPFRERYSRDVARREVIGKLDKKI